MNPKLFWLVTAILLVSFHQAEAQQPKKVPRIGFLGLPSASSFGKQMEALRAGLRDLGYSKAKTFSLTTAGPRATTIGSRTWQANWFGLGSTSS